jgi:phosphoglucosamine mutase
MAAEASKRTLFGTDGIRGRSNCYPITPEVALQLGKAIAHTFAAAGSARKRAVIGKDTRLSGYMLETALTSGLVSMGMDVLLAGPIPTPSVAHLTRSMNATVGIMLTASHNPFDDNGIKIFDGKGFKLSDEIESQIEGLVLRGELTSEHIRSEHLGKAFRIEDARGRYIEFAKNTIQNVSLEGLKIVLDCANGASYLIGPWIFRELGAEVIKTGVEPDGFNINSGCGALYPDYIEKLVHEHKADVGIAFDGDADRVLLCDHTGKVVDGDHIVAMCAVDFRRRGALALNSVVVTVMSNLGFFEAMKAHDIAVQTTAVGDRYVIERMRKNGYNLGGEKSGHIVFMDHATTGDGIIGALQVLRLMQVTGKPLSALSQVMEDFPQRLINIKVNRKIPVDTLPRLSSAIQDCESELGVGGRVLARYSGTEDLLRILVESRDQGAVDRWAGVLETAAREDLRQ